MVSSPDPQSLDGIQRQLEAYEQFTACIERENYLGAYQVFRRNSGLISFMCLAELPYFHLTIAQNVGRHEAEKFRQYAAQKFRTIEETLESDAKAWFRSKK